MKIKFKDIQKGRNEKVCFVCRNQEENGIIIARKLICKSCQSKMLNANINSKQYDFYKDKIKEALTSKYNFQF